MQYPLSLRMSTINPPAYKQNSIQSPIGFDQRTLYEVSHEVQTITSSFYDCNGEIILVSDERRPKMSQKPTLESKKIRILGENGIPSKLKHTKVHNSILSGRFGDPYKTVQETGRFVFVSGRVGKYGNHTLTT